MLPVQVLIFAVSAPLLLGVLGMFLPRGWIGTRVALSALAPIGSLTLLGIYAAVNGLNHGPVEARWMPSLDLSLRFHADQLGFFFACLVAGIGVLITLYGRAYFGPDRNALYRFYPSLMLFMTAMLGLVLADNFVLLLLFWELTSVSSFLLIGWERDDKAAVKNALQAFVVTGIGGLALLGGLLLLGVTSGSWSFSDLALNPPAASAATTAAFVMIFLGAAAKSAQWPVHFWLPGAMAAPTPISAYLHSATMVKAGVYLLGRLIEPMAALTIWPWLLVPVGAITMLLGAYLALRKYDLKLIFAYTTVSQLGLFVCMYGLAGLHVNGKPVVLWDVTQIFSHALYKAPLFMLAGAIAHMAYTRDLRDLRGLFHQGRRERLLSTLLLLAAYAMAAGPLTLAFTGKELFFYGLYHAWQAMHHPILLVLMAVGVAQGALNVAIFVRLARVLLSRKTSDHLQDQPHDPDAEEERIAFEDYHAIQIGFWSAMLWVPAGVILALQYVGGIVPGLFDRVFGGFERGRVYFDTLPGLIEALRHPGVPLAMSAAAMAIGVGLGFSRAWRPSVRDWHDRIFPGFYLLATRGGGRVFGLIQTGNLRTYLVISLLTLLLLLGWAVRANPGDWRLPARDATESFTAALPGYLLAMVLCTAAVLVPLLRQRAAQVMALGAVGFAVAGMFYVFNGPDVALTQISVEIVAVILFLLVLALLPQTTRTLKTAWSLGRRVPRMAIAVAVGAAMCWLTYASATATRPAMPFLNAEGRPFASAGEFFLRNSYKGIDTEGRNTGGGGRNAVNVILVDFRGFDTFGEIMVLSLAALGVWTLLRGGKERRDTTRALRDNLPPQAKPDVIEPPSEREIATSYRRRRALHSESLQIMTRVLVPLSLLFAIHVYFKGHNVPGGGFVAGLVAAIALIVLRMAYGRAHLRHMLRVRERTLIGGGLLLALLTGAIPLLLGRPFLYSAYGYLRLPGTTEHFHLASVLGFDLGVFLVVMGVVLGMTNAVSEELEEQ